MAAKKKKQLTPAQEEKLRAKEEKAERARVVAKAKSKAPRQVFVVVAGNTNQGAMIGEVLSTHVKQKEANEYANEGDDEVVMGPYVLAERKRN